ncbi:MAG: histone deacetylase family protein [Actinomycetota bacterium]
MIPVVRSPLATAHVPGAEIWLGTRTPGTEVPERVAAIEASLADWPTVEATAHDDEVLLAVHDARLVEHLRTIWSRWDDYGTDRVVPYLFPTEGLLGDLPEREPVAPHAAAGRYCYDTMTLVGPGTWEGASAAVDVALTCVDVVGDGVVYGLTRPPGHHVTRSAYGGSCYLNNAAVAAEGLRRAGHGRVAVIDIDAHHGNGTQDIFYRRGDVLYGSLHVDPGAGWFPHYAGFTDEGGIGDGVGATLNIPLAPGVGDDVWLDGVRRLADAVSSFGATALVVSLGVDAAADDPESPLRVSVDGYGEAGRILGELSLPTVALQEGGYHLPTLGSLVRATLEGLRE